MRIRSTSLPYINFGPVMPLREWPVMMLFYAVGIAEDAVTLWHRGTRLPSYRSWALGLGRDRAFRVYPFESWKRKAHLCFVALMGLVDSFIALPTLGLVRPDLRAWALFSSPTDWFDQ